MAVSDDLSIPNTEYRTNRAGRYGNGQSRTQQSMDPDTRRLMFFAGGLGVVLLALIGASAIVGRHSNVVPVITADTHPIREKPVNPGGMKIDGAENDVFSAGSDTSNAKLAPRAETPDTNALEAATAAPPAAERPATAAMAPPAAPVSVAPPPPLPASKPAVVTSVSPAAVKPVLVKPSAAAAETHSAASGRPAMVQFAALTSEEAARHEWEQLTRRMPELLKGHQPSYSRTERDGHTFWRLRTTGFADAAQARGFCEHVHAKGAGCSIADF